MSNLFSGAVGTLLALAVACSAPVAFAQAEPLPSWNDGPARQAILDFVQQTTDPASPRFVPPDARVATFDQDGTLWVEHPMYAQVAYCLDQVPRLVAAKPELANEEPFKTVLTGNAKAIEALSKQDLEKVFGATLSGMTVDTFTAEVRSWLSTARDPRWKRAYTELAFAPMLELLDYLRTSGYETYIVTGGGQDFVRVYSEQVYGVPVDHVVGSAAETRFGYGEDGKPTLTKEPRLLFDDDATGKPEAIHLVIGRRPALAVGNSTGDQQMLEYTSAGDGGRLSLLVLHDDAVREYAYGPAQGLPDTKVGTFPTALYDEAQQQGWIVVSMKDDWNRIFAWESAPGTQ
ncbi:MAG: HAD family hydrolase [Myxococcota bacterium]